MSVGGNIDPAYFAKLLSELLLLPPRFFLNYLAEELLVLWVIAVVLNIVHDSLNFFVFWCIFLALL